MMQPSGSYRGKAPQSSIARTEKPSIVPSAFTGTSRSRKVRSFPCAFAVCWSVRHSVHWIGRFSFRASRQQATNCGWRQILLPKAPPMSCVTKRSLSIPTRRAGAIQIAPTPGADDRRQRLVLDLDELGRVAGEPAARRHDRRDRLAHVPHLADRERVVLDVRARRRRELEERIGEDRDLVAGERPVDAADLERTCDVDRLDLRVPVRRTDELDVARAVPLHVVEEDALALDEPLVLLARHVLADEPRLGLPLLDDERPLGGDRRLCHSLTSWPDAARIARTMFTYPVQRQMLPWMARRISSSLGRGFRSTSALALISIPGVQ